MNTEPLAYKIRPQTMDGIIGQDHLVGKKGVLRKMVDNKQFSSLILYGPPGIGKTTIAMVMGECFGLRTFVFNASTDNKAQLKEIIEGAKHYGALVIIDEIHRMKKDIQDYLLPYVEKGAIVVIGITTNNPYHSVNPAIRSRMHVYKLKPIDGNTLIEYLKQIHEKHTEVFTITLDANVYEYIVLISNCEIRSAINRLELLEQTLPNTHISLDSAKEILLHPTLHLDKNEDNYFNILSAFQKSIRGSDVDASLHYLARLIAMEDLDSILRRMTVIVYEDIGLANPSLFAKMEAAAQAVLRVGLPEARIILSAIVIEMALSPKSNSAYLAIEQALADIEKGLTDKIPNHLINIDNFESKNSYRYPHDFPDHIVSQDYLPESMAKRSYYTPQTTGKYEEALKMRYEAIKKRLQTKEKTK